MIRIFILPFLLLLCLSCNQTGNKSSKASSEKWIQLFNGKDLDDWDIKLNKHPLGENFNNTFLVRDGKLVINYAEYDTFNNEFGHIFYKTPYSHYKLRVEYRVVGEQVKGGPGWALKNNGVMFHCQSPDEMLVDQEFPVCLEAQLLGGLGDGERSTGNLCTPGTDVMMHGKRETQHCINSTSATYNGDVWVHFELVVLGDSVIYHIVEGDTVLTYSKPQIGGELPEGFPLPEGTPVRSGYIALQAETHPFEFRKVELLDLGE